MLDGPELIKVEFTYLPVLNFAMQQNGVSVIRAFSIENISGKVLNDVRINLALDPAFGEALPCRLESILVNGVVRVDGLKLQLSTDFFIRLTERMTGNMLMEITAEDVVLFKNVYPIDVLTYDQWGGLSVLPEMLSAFVTPNHPSLIPIQQRAASILEEMTGKPDFDEYQSRNPNRVKSQMAAIYNAIAEQEIIYSSVPASFEKSGQRVRMVDSVLSQKIGTCLDMALLYASCLEAVGVHPLIVVLQGHAFAGGWLIPGTFPDSVVDDGSFLTKRIADGINEIILVETTLMNKGAVASFDNAAKLAYSAVKTKDNFRLALDVKRSRFSGIRPLPQRIINGDVWEIKESDTVSSAKEFVTPEVINPYDLSRFSTDIEVTKQLMWERKLLDLSLRNNLLNTRVTRNTLQLISADLDEFEDLLADGNDFVLLPKPNDWNNPLYDFGIYHSVPTSDPIIELVRSEIKQKRLRTYLSDIDLEKALRHIYRSYRLSIEENGANTLYLALGLLRWYETPNSERPRYAPILLLPVEMVKKSAAKGYVIRSREEDIITNITLLEMLRQNFGINVPGLESLPKDERGGVNVKLIHSLFRNSIKNQPKWDVEEESILGIFSFNKFIMWNDIHNNSEMLLENPLVRSLVNGKIEFKVDDGVTNASELDNLLSPADIVLPISADSSQLEAVYEALNGKTYILHGPPGTGKSQTITNIIVNALYHGKRVLFVAEKMAALSVVRQRLESIGLAPFCLELHSNKAKKTDVLSQLRRTTEMVKSRSPESFARDAHRLFELRKELNKVVEALHRPHVIGLSLYQAITKYMCVEVDDILMFPHSLLGDLTENRFLEWEDAIDLIVSVGNACGHPHSHPLREINITNYSVEQKEHASSLLNEAIRLLNGLTPSIAKLRGVIGDKEECDYSKGQIVLLNSALSILFKIPELTPALLIQPRHEDVLSECVEAIGIGRERDLCKEKVIEVLSEDVLTINAKSLLDEWKRANDKWFLPRFFGRKRVQKKLRPYIPAGKKTEIEIEDILSSVIMYQEKQKQLDVYTANLQLLFGNLAKPAKEEWNSIRQVIEDFSSLNDHLISLTNDLGKADLIKKNLAEQLSWGMETFRKMHGNAFSEFRELWTRLNGLIEQISGIFNVEAGVCMRDEPMWIDNAAERLNRWLSNMGQLKDWYQWKMAERRAVDLGIGFATDAYCTQNIAVNRLKDTFRKGFYRAVSDYILEQESDLSLFKGEIFNDLIEKYKKLSANFIEVTKKELYAKLAANIPSFTFEATHNSEVGILQRSIRNNARGVSIRNLFDQIPNLLSRMSPCMLMSPISVAQYINPSAPKFDLVIFDEASQIPTYEAVGTIARGENMIIVGDPKQMPPTNFFSVNNVDEDNLDKEDLESILDDSLALSIPSRYLLWHYRSKHESLIAFSNSEYYDNRLMTFPSPDNIESKVRLVQVDGYYDKGRTRRNEKEAEAIIQEIERRLSDKELRKKSIGVVTFSAVQQNLIEDLLSDLFLVRTDLEQIAQECEEPLFIKNLENVQGDERDVILFSIGYGPDEHGRVSMNFGPLNRIGGERRLNVAVSRARYEMIIFSTLRSDQIDLNRTSAVGVKGLKRFLEFAEKGERPEGGVYMPNETDLGIEHLVAEKLREKGYEVHTNIGASGYKVDIAVLDDEQSGKYVLGILCDGENYKRIKTVRDREIIQNSVLRMLGWNICRVWTLDWKEDPAGVLKRIEDAIENAKKCKPEPPDWAVSDAENRRAEDDTMQSEMHCIKNAERIKVANDIRPAQPHSVYRQARLLKMYPSEALFLPGHEERVINQIQEVIHLEAPISYSLLCKRILDAWGISRLGPRIESHLNRLFDKAECFRHAEEGECLFFWRSEDDFNSYDGFRFLAGRTVFDLSAVEVANAMKYLLESQISVPLADLLHETAQLFGYGRIGAQIEAVLMRGLHEAEKRNYCKMEDGRVIIA